MECSHSVHSTEKLSELSRCFFLVIFVFLFYALQDKNRYDIVGVCLNRHPQRSNLSSELSDVFYTSAFPKVLSAATIVAKHTSALCNACRLASSKTSNPVAKRQFVQSAKEVANSTANLVKSIKVSVHPNKRFQFMY